MPVATPAESLCREVALGLSHMVSLRRMTVADLPEVLSLENDAFQAPWSRRAFLHEINNNPAALPMVATIEGRTVGYLVAWMVADEAHIATLAVAAGWRRQGIGRILLEHVLQLAQGQRCRAAYLEVRRSNHAAQALYAALGFQHLGVRPRYYAPQQEDALVMVKRIHEGEEEHGLV